MVADANRIRLPGTWGSASLVWKCRLLQHGKHDEKLNHHCIEQVDEKGALPRAAQPIRFGRTEADHTNARQDVINR